MFDDLSIAILYLKLKVIGDKMSDDTKECLKQSIGFINGKYLPFEECNLSIASSSVLYGLSIYTVNAFFYNSQKKIGYNFRLDKHYQRLLNSAKIMGFCDVEKILSFEDFQLLAQNLVIKNNANFDSCLRYAIYIDSNIAGTKILDLPIGISAFLYKSLGLYQKPIINLGFSSWARIEDNMIPPRAKVNGMYASACLMKSEAIKNGFDDALILDRNGHVTESTAANLFLVKDGKLYTPSEDHDLLIGITRDSILNIAHDLGIETIEDSIDRTECYLADEMFLCGSSAKITPVSSLDHRKIGSGEIGPITKSIMQAFDEIVAGDNPKYSHWLTPIKF